jgi:hypothetical protein
MLPLPPHPLANPDVFALKKRLNSYCLEQGLRMRSEQEVNAVLIEEFGSTLAQHFQQDYAPVYQQLIQAVMQDCQWDDALHHNVVPFTPRPVME